MVSAATGEFLLHLRCPWSLLDFENPQPLVLRLPAPSTPPRCPLTSSPPPPPAPLRTPLPSRRTPSPKTFSQLFRKVLPNCGLGAGGRAPPDRILRGVSCRPPRRRRRALSGRGGCGAGPAGAASAGTALPGPSDCGAADRIADAGPPALPAPPSSRGRRGCRGRAAAGSAPLAPCAPGGFPSRAPVRGWGPARSRRLCLPLPLSAAPRVPRGWGFPSRSPPPAPLLGLPLPRPPLCMCHRAPCPPAHLPSRCSRGASQS